MKRHISLLLLILFLIAFVASGCGGASKSERAPQAEAPMMKTTTPSMPAAAPPPSGGTAAPKAPPTEARKIIETAQITLETRDLAAVEAKVIELLAAKNGKIDVSNVSIDSNGRKQGSYTLRVPMGRLQELVKEIAAIPDVIVRQRNISAQDVTEEFVDINARLENMQRQELRLREILAKANTVDEILKVEKELAGVRTQIESTTARLKTMTGRIDMSTINLRITEVTLATETNFGGKVMRVVRDSIVGAGDVILYLIAFLIVASPLAVIVLFGVWFYRRRKKKQAADQTIATSTPPRNPPNQQG